MIKVGLHGAEFFAFHGFYPQEQLLGCRFVIDIEVEFEPPAGTHTDHIADTVNYEQLYAIAAREMKNTRKLLERVVDAMLSRIRADFPFLQSVRVEMKKLNPPMGGQIAYTSVTASDVKAKEK